MVAFGKVNGTAKAVVAAVQNIRLRREKWIFIKAHFPKLFRLSQDQAFCVHQIKLTRPLGMGFYMRL